MKLYLKIFSIVFSLFNIILYTLSFSEGQNNIGTPDSSFLNMIFISLEYYFLWVLAFWLIPLSLVSLIITTIIYIFYNIKIKSN